MLTLLLVIFFIVVLFRITGFMFHIAGKLLGFVLSGIGWLILAVLAVTVFGVAVFILPVILIAGVIAVIVGAIS